MVPEPAQKTDDHSTGRLFAASLLRWNACSNRRKMPWKGEKNPYKIWLSEIMLQQTRVEQGIKYYEKFISQFPDIHALANAPDEAVFKAWEGLGYYSRCRNLISTARFISRELKGIFPREYHSILALKGVGTYTAAAIASFAYNLPYAVLDGNVFRVLSRIFGIETPVDSAAGKKEFASLAQSILPAEHSAEYNQAIMDFGALVCKPQPECNVCFFSPHCKAFASGNQYLLPIKEKRTGIRQRWLNYFVLLFKDEVVIHRRQSKDIWQDLHEFVLIETQKDISLETLAELFEKQYGIHSYRIAGVKTTRQKLTHQAIELKFLFVHLHSKKEIAHLDWVKKQDLEGYAFPKSLKEIVDSDLVSAR